MAGQFGQYPAIGGVPVYSTFSAFPASASNGSLAIAGDTDTLYIYSTTAMAWEAIGGTAVPLGVGVYDSQAPQANGLDIANNLIYAQSASGSVPGMVSIGNQTFSGIKNFSANIFAANLSGTNSGDVTLGTSNGLSLTGQALSLVLASTSTTGALSSTDWNTFNGKQASGSYITALTGDGTATGPGSAALTLATVNTTTGPFGSSTSIPSFTVNGKGLITAAAANVVIAPAGTLSGTTLNSTVVTSSLTSLGTVTTGVWSGTTVAVLHGGTGVTTVTTVPAATTFAGWDANKNLTANAHFSASTSIATAAGTTTLTIASTQLQTFTGSTTQTVVLPTTGVAAGMSWTIINLSTGNVTVNASAGGSVMTMSSNKILTLISNSATPTTPAGWMYQYAPYNGAALAVGSGGTGLGSFTAYAPITGGTTATNQFQSASTGQSNVGWVLTSTGTSSLPTWQAPTSSSTAVGAAIIMNSVTTFTPGTPLNYNQTLYDTNTAYNHTTGAYTCPLSGLWLVSLSCILQTGSGGGNIYVAVNGTGVSYISSVSPSTITTGSTVLQCTAGQIIQIFTDNTIVVNGNPSPPYDSTQTFTFLG